jgi:nitroreductase
VIMLFHPRGMANGPGDCHVMGENMMLAAHALGVGSCLVARGATTFDGPEGQRLLEQWGVPADYEPLCHIVLGYRDGPAPQAKPRRPGRIFKFVFFVPPLSAKPRRPGRIIRVG